MPPTLYQILHITGAVMVFLAYGALLGRSLSGDDSHRIRKLGAITSGIGLLLMLVAGFALISKIGYAFTEPWLLIKMGIWVALGGMVVLINRAPQLGGILWWVLVILGMTAAAMVYVKPFQKTISAADERGSETPKNSVLIPDRGFVFLPVSPDAPVAQLDRAPDYGSGG